MDSNKLCNISLESEIDEIIEHAPQFKGAKEIIQKLKKYIKPRVYWMDLKRKEVVENILHSGYLTKGLQDCEDITFIAVTIGEDLMKYSEKAYEEGKLWESTIANILGSYAVEALIEKFHKSKRQEKMKKGIYSSPRFSPGYGDWDLCNQKHILSLLNTNPDIRVDESYMLHPIKSITAVIGWSFIPKTVEYPKGEKRKGLCEGNTSCAYCKTWACKK